MLDIIIRELPQLMVIDANDFCFLGSTEREARDQVHDEEDDAGAKKGVGEAGDGVGELIAELNVVAVEPAAGYLGEAVQVGDVVTVREVLVNVL